MRFYGENMMKLRKSLLVAMCVASLGAASVPIAAGAAEVYFNIAPPAPRVEVIPAPRSGHLWVPGFWDARANRHVWVRGHWERERRGYRFVEPRWVQRDNRWLLERGRWSRGDRDGDGVPNSRDRAPNNPYRR
jgi:WXXGXW repeat (2 copies)